MGPAGWMGVGLEHLLAAVLSSELKSGLLVGVFWRMDDRSALQGIQLGVDALLMRGHSAGCGPGAPAHG